jgi:hypothetical protein
MKRILLLVTFILYTHLLAAQDQTIGPVNNLNVIGNLVVKQSLVKTSSNPTTAQTYIVPFTSGTFVSNFDSTGRIKDHQSPPALHAQNQNGFVFISPLGTPPEAFEISFEYFSLGGGDSLIISHGTTVLMRLGNGFVPGGTYTFNVPNIRFAFISNTDFSLGTGFSLVWRRLYNNPSWQQPSLQPGNSLVFNRVSGAISSGKALPATPGIYSSAMGYHNMVTGAYAAALGYKNEATENSSFAVGLGNKASGQSAVALGNLNRAGAYAAIALGANTNASGTTSFTAGYFTNASGENASALGYATTASGGNSLSAGVGTLANSYAAVSLGSYNYSSPQAAATSWVNSDPVLLIGNGTSGEARSNILEFYKDGDLVIAGNLALWSDEKLKRDIKPIERSMEKLSKIKGYHYYWKNAKSDQQQQTGLLAQEVKEAFPELVTKSLNGDLAVNYIGLIPHLLVAIRELKQELDELKNINTQAAVNGILKLYDVNGKMVKQMTISIQKGKNTIPVNLPGLAAGNYELTAEWGNGMKKQVSIVKQ